MTGERSARTLGAVDLRRFDQPDELRTFEKGRLELIRISGLTVGRASYEPGWRWSKHVGRAEDKALCDVAHVGLVVSGRNRVRMADGEEFELTAGDLFAIAPGHDSWVVGDEPYVSLHLVGADSYAAKQRAANEPAAKQPTAKESTS
jgi:quercetin dioxygenase-like cupin family protein